MIYDKSAEGSIEDEYNITSLFTEHGIYEEFFGIDNVTTRDYYLGNR